MGGQRGRRAEDRNIQVYRCNNEGSLMAQKSKKLMGGVKTYVTKRDQHFVRNAQCTTQLTSATSHHTHPGYHIPYPEPSYQDLGSPHSPPTSVSHSSPSAEEDEGPSHPAVYLHRPLAAAAAASASAGG